jgi:2-methylcitrate dehydratase PrpD
MAYKSWVDVNAFNDAFEQALTHHHPSEVGGALLATTTRVATAIGWDRTTPKAI